MEFLITSKKDSFRLMVKNYQGETYLFREVRNEAFTYQDFLNAEYDSSLDKAFKNSNIQDVVSSISLSCSHKYTIQPLS